MKAIITDERKVVLEDVETIISSLRKHRILWIWEGDRSARLYLSRSKHIWVEAPYVDGGGLYTISSLGEMLNKPFGEVLPNVDNSDVLRIVGREYY